MKFNTQRFIRTAGLALAMAGFCHPVAVADASYVPLPDNGLVAQATYATGAVQQATTDSINPTPYVPVVPEVTAYSAKALTATPAQFTPARTANSALVGTNTSQASPTGIFLTLSTLTPTAAANSNVTVTLSLVDNGDTATGPGSALFSFDTNIGLNNTYLTFVGGFTAAPGSPFTYNDSPSFSNTASNLRVAYDVISDVNNPGPYFNATNGTPVTLGSFVVHVASGGLPPAGTTVTLGSQLAQSGAGGSEVINSAAANVLTGVNPVVIAPEPPGTLSVLVGIAGISLLAWRKRSRVI